MFKINSIRRKLIVGLAPGFVVLVAVTAIGYLGLDIQSDANQDVIEASAELEALNSLEISLQQVLMPPNDYLILGEASDEHAQFETLAATLETQLAAARPRFGEESEQRLLDQVEKEWREMRRRSEAIFAQPAQPFSDQSGAEMEALDAMATTATGYLQALHDIVRQERDTTIAASARARTIARWLLFISGVASVAGGILFTALFSRHLTDPIVSLREGAVRIGTGDLAFRLRIKSNDELGTLAAEFNRMAAHLQGLYMHLEERVAERTAQLRALDDASRTVASELELDKVLQRIVDLALDLYNASRAGILVLDQDDGRPRFVTATIDPTDLDGPNQPSKGLGLLNSLLQTNKPLRLCNTTSDPAAAGLQSLHPAIHCFLGVPIIARGKAIGALYVTDPRDGSDFRDEDEQMMVMLAAHAAVAIENARLYEEIRRINEALETRVQERTTQLKAVSEERTRYAEALRQVLDRTVRVQEEERQRIAKEMHDGVSQWLLGALYEMQAAKLQLPQEPAEAIANLDDAQAMLKRVKEEMRRVIYDLHPPVLESNGLAAALRSYANEYQRMTGIPCQVEVSGICKRLLPKQELALYRIAQEALHNAAVHAAARQVTITVAFNSDEAQLCISDDGSGFSLEKVRSGSQPHLGLLGMYERAYSVGGDVRIESAPGQGTRIYVRTPLVGRALDFDAPLGTDSPREAHQVL